MEKGIKSVGERMRELFPGQTKFVVVKCPTALEALQQLSAQVGKMEEDLMDQGIRMDIMQFQVIECAASPTVGFNNSFFYLGIVTIRQQAVMKNTADFIERVD